METNLFKHTVLWADDDADDLLMMREILEHLSDEHRIVEASNGKQALDYLELISHPKELPCLIVLDINMPILNGRDTLALLKSKEKYSTIPVVVFTTSSSESDHAFCKNMGAEVFTKPPSYESLKNTVQHLLAFCHS